MLTDASGSFSITSDYTCPAPTTEVYLVATGGNPGLAAGTNNPAIAMMAALGQCGLLNDSTYVSVNELTTVGALAAFYPYMSSVASLGFAETAQLTAAFAVATEYTDTAMGTVPGPALPSGYYAASIEIKTLADALAACINSSGTVTSTSACGMLFALATPPGGSAPVDTIGAMLNILKNPSVNVAGILALVSSSAPFQPTLPAPPASWSLPIVPLPATPAFSVAAGTYSGGLTVALSSGPGAVIYYTTDGTAPTASSPRYSAEVQVSSTETINAIAAINPYVTSTIGTAAYTISGSSGNASGITVATNANGNITGVPSADGLSYVTATYNNANRLASVTGTPVAATYVYDWAGQRYSKTNGGIPPTLYSYAQDGTLLAENDNGAVTDYIYADGRPIAQIQPGATPAVDQVSYVLADRLGTPQRLVNSSGASVWSTTYQPFGTTGTINATVNQNLRFPGQLAGAETGFSYNHFRDYMPNLGRYLETDPIGLNGGTDSYSYVSGRPTVLVDPAGTDGFFGIPTNTPVPDMSQLPPWVSPFDAGLPSIKLPRVPDSITITLTDNLGADVGGAFTVDIYGNIYASAVVGVGLPTALSCSLSANYYGGMFGDAPSDQDLQRYITGPELTYSGGALFGYGVGDTLSKNNTGPLFGSMYQSFSLTTPGANQQYSYTKRINF